MSDRVTVIFSTRFKDADDVVLGKVFLQVSLLIIESMSLQIAWTKQWCLLLLISNISSFTTYSNALCLSSFWTDWWFCKSLRSFLKSSVDMTGLPRLSTNIGTLPKSFEELMRLLVTMLPMWRSVRLLQWIFSIVLFTSPLKIINEIFHKWAWGPYQVCWSKLEYIYTTYVCIGQCAIFIISSSVRTTHVGGSSRKDNWFDLSHANIHALSHQMHEGLSADANASQDWYFSANFESCTSSCRCYWGKKL